MMSHLFPPLLLLVFLTGGVMVSVKASDNVIRCEYDNVCQATQKLMSVVSEMKNQQDERGDVQATDLEELKVKLDRSLVSTAVISTQLEEHSGDLLSVEECLKAQLECPLVNEKLEKLAANVSHIHNKQVKDAEELKGKLDTSLASTSVISKQLEKHSSGLISLEERLKTQQVCPDVNAMLNKLGAKASDIYSKQVKDVEELKVKLERSLASTSTISTQLEKLSANLLHLDERLKAHDVSQTDLHKSVQIRCPLGFTYLPAAGSCYKILYQKSNWIWASHRCRNLHLGSDLVAINSEAENTALRTFLASELSKNPDKNACLPTDKSLSMLGNVLWTSGQRQKGGDCKTPFVWKLLSREIPFTYTHWLGGEPNCGGNTEFCMDLWANKGYRWNDVPCNIEICPVCEYTPK